MILVWRGWGLIALAVWLLPAAGFIALFESHRPAGIAAVGAGFGCGGLICLRYGRRWNQGTGFHALYWLPLEFWGWAYILAGGLVVAGTAAWLVLQAVAGPGFFV